MEIQLNNSCDFRQGAGKNRPSAMSGKSKKTA